MRRTLLTWAIGLSLVTAAAPSVAASQAAASGVMSHDELMSFARIYVAIGQARDSVDVELAQARNKKDEAQQQLRDKLRDQIAEILHHGGMTNDEYQRKVYYVSTNDSLRKTFDGIVAQLTGVPTPGQAPATAPPPGGFVTNLPAGAVGTHIGHVVNAFSDTPDRMGLLPMAMAEARIAAQHATLAGRDPTNLANMQLHAGHVINALDPTIVTAGPGRGYGVKKAATGVATHIELAAKAPGASQNVIMHSVHIATAARSTVARADSIIAIAQKIRAATSAADAAALVGQMASLADQLIKGADLNADGKVSWDKGEGGLQQAQEHITLLLNGEERQAR